MENIKDKAPPNLGVGELSGALMGDHHTIARILQVSL